MLKVRKCVDERISMKWIGVSVKMGCNKLLCVFHIFSWTFLSSFLRYLLLSWLSNTTIGLKWFWSCILIFTPLWFHKIFMQHLITLCVPRVLKYQKKSYQHSTRSFMTTWWVDCKNVQKKNFTVAFCDNPHYLFWDAHGQAG